MPRKSNDLISINHLPGILLASADECERWIASGLIPVADRRSFRTGGRLVEERLFDPVAIAALAPDVPLWRAADETAVQSRRSQAGRRAEPLGAQGGDPIHRRRKKLIRAVEERSGTVLVEAAPTAEGGRPRGERGPGRDFGGYQAEFALDLPLLAEGEQTVKVEMTFAEPPEVEDIVLSRRHLSRGDTTDAAEILGRKIDHLRQMTVEACRSAALGWRDELETYLSAYEDDDRIAILRGIRSAIANRGRIRSSEEDGPDGAARQLRQMLDEFRSRATARRLRHLREIQIRAASGYERYAAIFPIARSLDRQFLFLAGPTNSGKTHEALRLAVEAETAEILSPLRLLALEHYERLSEEGLAAGMVTGEERVVPDGTTHIARTIETLDLGRVVDVCVIDEVQMLGDNNRGWAWTQAIVGAPARMVVLTGAPEAIPLVEHLLAMTGEPLKVRILKRKGDLRVESAPVDLNKLSRGDAVVAFSRSDVHDLRTRLVRSGKSVATVYGALGPEVRRAEAARFRNGEAEILVATDAIGMGLNIGPLRRVVFSTLSKFDGIARRQLAPMEIKQIAGRAGRFGHHDEGWVTALPEAGPFTRIRAAIENALTGEVVKLKGKAYVRPNQETVLAASEVLRTDRLGHVLQYLNDTLVAGHPDLRMADMEEVIHLAQLLDPVSLPLLDRLSYAMAPVDGREGWAVDQLLSWADQHGRHGWVGPPNFGVSTDLLKLETRAKIVTTWLWLAQRYPNVYEGVDNVLDLRSDLNARIEEKLVATSVSRLRHPGGRKRGHADNTKGRKSGRRGRQKRGVLVD